VNGLIRLVQVATGFVRLYQVGLVKSG